MYRIEIVPDAAAELEAIPVFHRKRVETMIGRQLLHEPTRENKNRKRLENLVAGFEHEDPIWELRVGEWRIFYDVSEGKTVTIRAIRRKPSGKRTEEIV